jgi:peptide/nickel transport system ATP-binding protein
MAEHPDATPVRSDPGAPEPVLEIRGLAVDYGYDEHPTHVLRGVDLTLSQGEVLGLAGESGCGKSTLAYGAMRLLPPPGLVVGGEVLFHDAHGSTKDILQLSDRDLRASRWRDTAIVFQGAMNSLNPVFRIERQLCDAIQAHDPTSTRQSRHKQAVALLDMVGIAADRLRSYPHELSGGMRQRVMIAMALALRPQVLIMDEPTTALDVVMQRQILEQIADLRRELGFSVIFITHDISLLIEIADRIAIMYAGEIVEQGGSDDLYHHPRHPYSEGLLGSFPPLHGERRELGGIAGSPPDLMNRPPGCPFAPRCAHVLPRCHEVDPPLGPSAVAGDDPARRVACLLHEAGAEVPATLAR